jgi:hypothetical protein
VVVGVRSGTSGVLSRALHLADAFPCVAGEPHEFSLLHACVQGTEDGGVQILARPAGSLRRAPVCGERSGHSFRCFTIHKFIMPHLLCLRLTAKQTWRNVLGMSNTEPPTVRERARQLVAEVERVEAKGLWSQWSREIGGQWITRAMAVLREVAR